MLTEIRYVNANPANVLDVEGKLVRTIEVTMLIGCDGEGDPMDDIEPLLHKMGLSLSWCDCCECKNADT